VGDFLVLQDRLERADIIHVIAGPDYRTDYGIFLYKKGLAKQIFFTGGICSGHDLSHAQRCKQRALCQGVPSDAIAIDESMVNSTFSEGERFKAYIAQSQTPVHSVIVVSDQYHMRRALWTYRQLLNNNLSIFMAPVPFDESPHKRRWWQNDLTRQYVRNEYFKIVYYFARYKLAFGPIKGWLASFDRHM
jgi:uncharacterized SAM-binding protein YcdF (DUF218 family)